MHPFLEDAIRDFPWGDHGLDIVRDPYTAEDWIEALAEHIGRRMWGNAPVPMSAEALADVLLDMSQAARARDSFDGSIGYEMTERTENEYDVTAAYRYGNAMHGQGFMCMIRGDL